MFSVSLSDVDVDEPELEFNLEEDLANIMEQHQAPDESKDLQIQDDPDVVGETDDGHEGPAGGVGIEDSPEPERANEAVEDDNGDEAFGSLYGTFNLCPRFFIWMLLQIVWS